MSRRSEAPTCIRVEGLLEAYVDGELRGGERSHVKEHLHGCEACRRQHALAVALQTELRALPEMDAPRAVIDGVLERARGEHAERRRVWWRSWRSVPSWAPLAAAGVALAVALPLIRPPDSVDPTVARADPAAVQLAAEQARLALGYVSRASRRTGLEIRDGVIGQRLVLPAAERLRSLSRHTFEGGSSNDES